MEQSFSTPSTENVSVTRAIIGPTRIPWDRLSSSGKSKRKQKIGRTIADAIKEVVITIFRSHLFNFSTDRL